MNHILLQTVVFGMGMGFVWLRATDALENPALSVTAKKALGTDMTYLGAPGRILKLGGMRMIFFSFHPMVHGVI